VPPASSATHRQQVATLADFTRSHPGFMAQLRAVRSLGLASWCIGAGAVRNLVWDALHRKTTASL
jgi:hypothetical protein